MSLTRCDQCHKEIQASSSMDFKPITLDLPGRRCKLDLCSEACLRAWVEKNVQPEEAP